MSPEIQSTPCCWLHYEGWSHVRQGRDAIEPVFTAAPAEIRDSIRWLEIGEATDIEV